MLKYMDVEIQLKYSSSHLYMETHASIISNPSRSIWLKLFYKKAILSFAQVKANPKTNEVVSMATQPSEETMLESTHWAEHPGHHHCCSFPPACNSTPMGRFKWCGISTAGARLKAQGRNLAFTLTFSHLPSTTNRMVNWIWKLWRGYIREFLNALNWYCSFSVTHILTHNLNSI